MEGRKKWDSYFKGQLSTIKLPIVGGKVLGGDMGRLSFGRVLDSLCLSNGSSSCFCTNSLENQDEYFETKPLVASEGGHLLRLKDVLAEPQTLAFQLKPKMVVLRVSMHCNGCARKVEKHISKMEGVTSYQVDLETKMVVVTGDIVPFEVLESVSKVKNAELWTEDDEARQPPHSTLSPSPHNYKGKPPFVVT